MAGRLAAVMDGVTRELTLRAGVMLNLMLFDRIELSPGVALQRAVGLANGLLSPQTGGPVRLRLGSAFQQGGGAAPLVRLRLFGGVGAYLSSRWELDPASLELAGIGHEAGLSLRF